MSATETTSPSPNPTGLLFYGVLTGDAAQVEAALNLGASANEPEPNHWEIVEKQAAEGNAKLFHLFFSPEAKRLGRSPLIAPPRPPLYFAVKRGYYDVALLLLDRGADPNWTAPPVHAEIGDSFALLPLAARVGDLRIVSALLRAGADVNQTTINGKTALRVAAKLGNVELVRRLLAAGANAAFVTPNGITLLMEAAGHGSVGFDLDSILPGDTVTSPLGLRRSISQTGSADETINELFSEETAWPANYREMARLLLENGADVHAVVPASGEPHDTLAGTTALQSAASSHDEETVRLLLSAGADPNAGNGLFGTPLTAAIGAHDTANAENLLRLLYERGASVNQTGRDGRTPLMAAAAQGKSELLSLLLSWGADPNARIPPETLYEAGMSALLFAVKGGHAKCIALLLDAGADENERFREGRDALMCAAYWRQAAPVRLLLDRGADPTRRGDDGKTAREWAETPTPFSQKAGPLVAQLGTTPEQIKAEVSQHLSDSKHTEKAIDAVMPKLLEMRIGFVQTMQANIDGKLRREAENQAEILQMLSDAEAGTKR